MDIDAMHGPELSDKQKAELMASRSCFYCFKVGHQAKDCRKKLADRTKSSRRTADNPTYANAQDKSTPDMTPSDIAQFLKDNVNTIDDVMDCLPSYLIFYFPFHTLLQTALSLTYITYLWNILAFSRDFHKVLLLSVPFYRLP